MLSLPAGILIVLCVSFLLGSIPFGVIIARVGYGADPRDGGSHSIGMTNMNRLFGFKAAALTFAGDVAKGALAAGFARLLLPHIALSGIAAHDGLLICAVLGSMFGHMFCPWLGFKGGKGISTGFGSIIVAFPLVCLCITGCFAVGAALTKTVSAGSICAGIGFPVFTCVFHWGSWLLVAVSVVVGVAVVYAHRGNIQRLRAGQEPKFSFNFGAKGSGNTGQD